MRPPAEKQQTGKNQSLVHQLLHGKESITEIFGILHARNVVAHFAQCDCAKAEPPSFRLSKLKSM